MEYPDTIKSSHDDEFAEIEGIGGSAGALMVDNEPTATESLYTKQKRLGVHPNENVIEYSEYIPQVDHE